MKQQTFEDFLEEKCSTSGALDMVLDDDMPDKVNDWMSELDVQEVIDYAEMWGLAVQVQLDKMTETCGEAIEMLKKISGMTK